MTSKQQIYLDYNATSPLRNEVRDAMFAVLGEPMNPSSIHKSGRKAREIMEAAKAQIIGKIGAGKMIFCGSGTEANNLALAQKSSHIISSIEHDSILNAAKNPQIVSVDSDGLVKLDELEKALENEGSHLVSIILANNETGVVQKMKPIAALCKKHGALLHIDAVQAFGKIRLNMEELGADMITICGHKVGGSIGAAALAFRADLELVPFMLGGGQQQNKRAGTEDVSAICGLAKLAEMNDLILEESAKIRAMRDGLEAAILAAAPQVIIHSANAPRLPNTSNIAMPNVEAATQLIHFDTNNIMLSSGAACSSGKVETSRILLAMDAPMAKNSVRVSLGYKTTQDEVDLFVAKWIELYGRINI